MKTRTRLADEVSAAVVLPVALWAGRSRDRNGNVLRHRRAVVEMIAVLSHLVVSGIRYPRIFLFLCVLNLALMSANALDYVL